MAGSFDARFVLSALAGASIALGGCSTPMGPPPPPILPAVPLDDAPRPLPPGVPVGDENRPAVAPAPPGPAPTGDHELDPLERGFYGCRAMGLRVTPSMSGKAVLQARLGPSGEVLDVTPVLVEGLPRTVVACLVDRIWNARFDPRGGDGSVLTIPVDFTRAVDGPKRTVGEPAPTRAL